MEEDCGAEILEDGELWLPPDFFSMDDVQASTTKFSAPLNYYSSCTPSCMDDLAQRFSGSTVHGRNFSKSPPALQGFTPEVPCRSKVSGPAACFGCIGGCVENVCACFTGSGCTRSSLVYPYQFLHPVQYLLHTFIEARPWTLQRQQHRFIPNRVLAIPGSGTGIGGLGGTGVFLPRISTNSSTAATSTNLNHQCAKKGQGRRSRLEVQFPHRKNLMDWKQEECHGYVPHEVTLPNDWTY